MAYFRVSTAADVVLLELCVPGVMALPCMAQRLRSSGVTLVAGQRPAGVGPGDGARRRRLLVSRSGGQQTAVRRLQFTADGAAGIQLVECPTGNPNVTVTHAPRHSHVLA